MKETAITFVEAAVEKVHYTLGLISGFGGIYEAVKYVSGVRPRNGFWHYVLAVDWFVGVAVVYTVIAFFIGAALMIVLSSLLFRAKDDPKEKQFSAGTGTSLTIIAPIVGIIIAIIYKNAPAVYSFADIPGLILFRLAGFAAIGLTLLFLFSGYQQALRHKTPLK